jgi:glycosyltransferase family protein
MSSIKTIKYIKKHKCNVSRYGDGEFGIIIKNKDIGFQKSDEKLKQRLIDILDKKNILICVPYYFNSTKDCNENAKHFWNYWCIYCGEERQKKTVKLLRKKCGFLRCYGDTSISRFYMDKKNKNISEKIVAELKSLWEDKNILIVEGEQTRLGVSNDLLSNSKSIKRILAPAINAWEKYDEIMKTVLECWKGELVLIALGPTATVLAADLEDYGIWAIDIGHIDVEYEWFIRKANKKIGIEGKYVNEVGNNHNIGICEDKEYIKEILRKI